MIRCTIYAASGSQADRHVLEFADEKEWLGHLRNCVKQGYAHVVNGTEEVLPWHSIMKIVIERL